jgi:hypothetical protein
MTQKDLYRGILQMHLPNARPSTTNMLEITRWAVKELNDEPPQTKLYGNHYTIKTCLDQYIPLCGNACIMHTRLETFGTTSYIRSNAPNAPTVELKNPWNTSYWTILSQNKELYEIWQKLSGS